MNVILIPCFDRPEFLWWNLYRLTKCFGSAHYKFLFVLDHGYDKDINTVIHWYDERMHNWEAIQTPRTSFKLGKQSYNVLNGWLQAARKTDDLVIMVEDDVMVATDFIQYHEAAQLYKPFASLSTANHNRKVDYPEDQHHFYYSHNDYCSLGVCMSKKVILNFIEPHVTNEYFIRPVEYVQKHFPGSSIGASFAEQDGLIRRIQETNAYGPTIYPTMPRAFHAGWYGKNRPYTRPTGSLQQRINSVGEVIFSKANMAAHSGRPEYYKDSTPIPLTNPGLSTYKFVPINLRDDIETLYLKYANK